jgi:hypothetical protein
MVVVVGRDPETVRYDVVHGREQPKLGHVVLSQTRRWEVCLGDRLVVGTRIVEFRYVGREIVAALGDLAAVRRQINRPNNVAFSPSHPACVPCNKSKYHHVPSTHFGGTVLVVASRCNFER